MDGVFGGLQGEVRTGEVGGGTDPCRSVIDGAGPGLRPCDEFLEVRNVEGGRYRHYGGRFADKGNPRKVANGIERQILVQRAEDGMARIYENEGVAIRGRGRDRLCGDEAACNPTGHDPNLLPKS